MVTPQKFRVWDPEGREMHEPPHQFVLNGHGVLIRSVPIASMDERPERKNLKGLRVMEDHKAMYWTGQTDHNYNDIYDGDIIETVYDDILLVEFNIIWLRFELSGDSDMDWSTLHKCCPKVAGNLYETPDLLAQQEA